MLYKRALSINSGIAELWFNYSNLCQKLKDLPGAESALRRAVSLNPGFPQAWFNLGNVQRDQENLSEAESCYLKTIEQAPVFSRAYTNLGNLQRRQSRFSEAVQQHTRARQLDPNNADICHNLANALSELKRYEEAVRCLHDGLQINPAHVASRITLGHVLLLMGQEHTAVMEWHRLLELEPGEVDAHLNLGKTYYQLKDNDRAVAHLRKAVEYAPDRVDCVAQLGFTLTELGQLTEGQELADRLMREAPDNTQTHMLAGFIAIQDARIQDGLDAFARLRELDPAAGIGVSNTCFGSLYADFLSAEQITALHREMSARVVKYNPAKSIHPRQRDAQSRIRVGYLSPDFRSHPVGFFMQPILERHDHAKFEIFGYGIQSSLDETSQQLIPHFDHWNHCKNWSDETLVNRMKDDKLDILVDLGGYTASCKMHLMACRLAPVQAIYLGYPCTTGMPEMDYIIADQYLIPTDHESLYTETPARLDASFLCFQPRPNTPDVAPLPALENGFVTFGSCNNLPKLSDRCIKLWIKVLEATPKSRLLLKALAFSEAGTRERVLARFSKAGLDTDRIMLRGPTVPIQKFLGEYSRIDIALDAVPYNGGTTTCDALWMGVPVVSLCGRHFQERMGASILRTLGRPEWVAEDEQDYTEATSYLAADLPRLGQVRKSLRAEMSASALCDGNNFTDGLEHNYQMMLKQTFL